MIQTSKGNVGFDRVLALKVYAASYDECAIIMAMRQEQNASEAEIRKAMRSRGMGVTHKRYLFLTGIIRDAVGSWALEPNEGVERIEAEW